MATGKIITGGENCVKKKRWIDNNTAEVYSQNPVYSSNGIYHEVSDDSGTWRLEQYPHNESSVSGYIRIDHKVKISLDLLSKVEIATVKKKLASDLNNVRSVKRKLEDVKNNGFVGHNVAAYSDGKVGTLSRANSEASCVGKSYSQVFQSNSVDNMCDKYNHDNGGEEVNVAAEEKENQQWKGNVWGCDNNLTSVGRQALSYRKELFKTCRELLGNLMKHQYSWVFNKPVDAKKLKLHDYYSIVKHPMDLGTVSTKLRKNLYKSPREFVDDVKLTFNNAMMYNDKGQDVHTMADVLLKLFEEKWTTLKVCHDFDDWLERKYDAIVPPLIQKKATTDPAHVQEKASISTPICTPKVAASCSPLIVSHDFIGVNTCALNTRTNPSKAVELNKLENSTSDKGLISFEEKHRLSLQLQNLPSEMLDGVVQIIKKRNSVLFQQEDEIEVDIDTFDGETLWELNQLVENYKKSLLMSYSIPKLSHQRREAGLGFHDINLASLTTEALREPMAVETMATLSSHPHVIQKVNVSSRLSSSSSSSSDSEFSSSDSDSDDSSGYVSDMGQ